jgi:hypothetical protein
MPSQRLAVHRTILVVDVEGFGDHARTNRDRLAVRYGYYGILAGHLRASRSRFIGTSSVALRTLVTVPASMKISGFVAHW